MTPGGCLLPKTAKSFKFFADLATSGWEARRAETDRRTRQCQGAFMAKIYAPVTDYTSRYDVP